MPKGTPWRNALNRSSPLVDLSSIRFPLISHSGCFSSNSILEFDPPAWWHLDEEVQVPVTLSTSPLRLNVPRRRLLSFPIGCLSSSNVMKTEFSDAHTGIHSLSDWLSIIVYVPSDFVEYWLNIFKCGRFGNGALPCGGSMWWSLDWLVWIQRSYTYGSDSRIRPQRPNVSSWSQTPTGRSSTQSILAFFNLFFIDWIGSSVE